MVKLCELCGAEADLHCVADSAFLCLSCDAKFHASNFLFSRHVRRIICPDCKSLTGVFFSGPFLPCPPRTTCCGRSCSSPDSSCCSSLDRVSSSNLSSTATRKTSRAVVKRARGREKRVKAVADAIFVNWCDELGLNGDSKNAVVSLASLALVVESKPTKVTLAAAFWFGVRKTRNTMMWPSLKKVEDLTGVAAGMIRAVESKLERAMTQQLRRWRVDSEEGWAENDNV